MHRPSDWNTFRNKQMSNRMIRTAQLKYIEDRVVKNLVPSDRQKPAVQGWKRKLFAE